MSLMARWLRIVGGLLILGGLLMIGLAALPLESLKEYGRLVRNVDDVSPERVARFHHVCWFAAVSLISVGGTLIALPATVSGFLQRTLQPATSSLAVDGHSWRWWLALILLVGAGLRLSLITYPMAYDEAYSWNNFASRPLLQALGDLNSTNNHLLNTVCMWAAGCMFGPQEWALRLGSFTFGLLALPITFIWARRWLGTPTALVTTALVAVSVPLVTYSADARGYVYILAMAVWLDDAFARLAQSSANRERSWLQAGTAIIVGVWAMIIMGYAVIATSMWYLIAGPITPSGGVMQRLRSLMVLGWLTAIGASVIYISGYIVRGTLFLNDPIMRQTTAQSAAFLTETSQGWLDALISGTEGGIPRWLIAGCCLLGLMTWPRDGWSLIRLAAPFLVMLGLNLVRHVTPPPRLFLWLLPWMFLLASHGVISIAGRWRSIAAPALTAAVLVLGGLYGVIHWPVLQRGVERHLYASVPDVVNRLSRETGSGEPLRCIVPLPCDVPTIFYRDRIGDHWSVNGVPQPGERIWLIARHKESPTDVLRSPLVGLSQWESRFEPWERVERFNTLDLYVSRIARSEIP